MLVLISDADINFNATTKTILRKYKNEVRYSTILQLTLIQARLHMYSVAPVTGPGPLDELAADINGEIYTF